MDLTTVIGIVLGVGCVFLGHSAGSQLGPQLAAAIIVLGGTLGAVITQFPSAELRLAWRQRGLIFSRRPNRPDALVNQLVELARKSRKEGLLALEGEAQGERDPFLKQALLALVDGNETPHLRTLLENAIDQGERQREPGPRFLEAAGGYAPTIGILGAVLGLIHVMSDLGEPSELGQGIAVAFVATIYGVGSANLVFLPLAGKMNTKIHNESRRRELIVDGVCAIQEGFNPQLIRKRLECYLDESPPEKKKRGKTGPTRPRARRR